MILVGAPVDFSFARAPPLRFRSFEAVSGAEQSHGRCDPNRFSWPNENLRTWIRGSTKGCVTRFLKQPFGSILIEMARLLTARQQREVDYHRDHARHHETREKIPVEMDVVTNKRRRWWNAYWSTYDILGGYDLQNMRVLVPGCGFGDDAVRIAHIGAEVHAFDISPEIVKISNNLSTRFN